MRISDWSSDVCSSDLIGEAQVAAAAARGAAGKAELAQVDLPRRPARIAALHMDERRGRQRLGCSAQAFREGGAGHRIDALGEQRRDGAVLPTAVARSEEHTSELQSLMRISYAV